MVGQGGLPLPAKVTLLRGGYQRGEAKKNAAKQRQRVMGR